MKSSTFSFQYLNGFGVTILYATAISSLFSEVLLAGELNVREKEMINTVEEFIQLRSSEVQDEYGHAAHDEAPIDVWLGVIEKHPDFREWVAHNKTVPIEILEILADDPDERVRHAVACKNKLPEELQRRLARDPDESVRLRIACNKNARKSTLELLQNDEWEPVRERATERLLSGKFKSDL